MTRGKVGAKLAFCYGERVWRSTRTKTIKDLTSAGFNEAQAEAVTRAVRAAAHVDLSDFATKHDLALLEAGIDAKMAKLANDLTWRVVVITATMNAILFAVLHFVH